MAACKSHFEIYFIALALGLGSEWAIAQSLQIRDLRPQFDQALPSPKLSMAMTWEEYLSLQSPTWARPTRSPASTQSQGSVREIVSEDDLRTATLKNQLAHMERDLNQSFDLLDDSPSGQRLEVHLTPIQSRASLRYVGFGEGELTYNPITESMLMVAQLKMEGGSRLLTQWMSGPLETSHQILWQWHF